MKVLPAFLQCTLKIDELPICVVQMQNAIRDPPMLGVAMTTYLKTFGCAVGKLKVYIALAALLACRVILAEAT